MAIRDYSTYSKSALDNLYASKEYYFMKHCEVIRLYHEGWSNGRIAEKTAYAVRTVLIYIRNYEDILLEYALGLTTLDEVIKDIYYDYDKPTAEKVKGYCAYLIYLNSVSRGDNLYAKVGYSANVSQRFENLCDNYKETCFVVPKKIYVFDNKGAAESMENWMREYYKSKYLDAFVEKDRFVGVHFVEEDIKIFDEKAKEFAILFSF